MPVLWTLSCWPSPGNSPHRRNTLHWSRPHMPCHSRSFSQSWAQSVTPLASPASSALAWQCWLFTLVSPLAPGLGTLLMLRALAGAASGGIMPLSLALVGDAVPLKERQVALSRLLVFAIGGQIGGGVLADVLGPWLGWRGVVWLCAGMVVLAAL